MRPVHCVVVAYHGAPELAACLESIGDTYPVTVVDNSSSVDVRAAALRYRAAYLDTGSNLGFGAGANIAIRRLLEGPAADVLLVNPDALLQPDAANALSSFLHLPGNERVGAASPCLVDPDGSVQRVEWPFPTPGRCWAEAIGLGSLPSRGTYVIGAVLLLRWEALVEVGLFDERFFLYAEETDWQRRARGVGWRSAIAPGVVASHVGAGTSSDSARREALFHAAHETYIRKWYGLAGWSVYRSGACLGAAARATVLGGERRTAAARRARLYLRGPRRSAAIARD